MAYPILTQAVIDAVAAAEASEPDSDPNVAINVANCAVGTNIHDADLYPPFELDGETSELTWLADVILFHGLEQNLALWND